LLAAGLEAYELSRAGAVNLAAPDANHVNHVYQGVFGVLPTASVRTSLVNQLMLDQQLARNSLAASLVDTAEYRTRVVPADYRLPRGRRAGGAAGNAGLALFGQPPAPAGQPSREERLEIQLTASREFFPRQVGTVSYAAGDGVHSNHSYVDALYTLVL